MLVYRNISIPFVKYRERNKRVTIRPETNLTHSTKIVLVRLKSPYQIPDVG